MAPREQMPVDWIFTYEPDDRRELFGRGYADAVRDMRDLAPQ